MIKKTGMGILVLIVLFQIFILICGIFAESYMIEKSSVNFSGNSISIKNENIKKFMDSGINLLIGFLSIKEIGTVSAAVGDAAYCCIETTNGGICETYPSEEQALCDDPIPLNCNKVNECALGCCYDSKYGTCTPSSSKEECESKGGEWNSDRTCAMSECRQGGCILGSNCFFETEKQCELRNGVRGSAINQYIWDSSIDQYECIGYSSSLIKGACVYKDSNCRIKTGQECITEGGMFYEGSLCSNPNLGTICEKQDSIGCVEGRDEIFWFDSCGNQENIYSSDKDASWNNGLILSKEDSCGDDEGNVESKTCGNCLSPISKCSATNAGVKDGDYICKDLGCENAIASGGTTKDRINGETWCVYEGSLEYGKSPVGSEFWRYTCADGEVELVDHSNQRTEICMENTIIGNGETYTIASLKPNEHQDCILLNSEIDEDSDKEDLEKFEEDCNENPFCYIKNIEVDKHFQFSMCLPKYPKGAELKDDAGNDENFCSLADATCAVVYEKKVSIRHPTGYWSCIDNCDCETSEFARKMQDLCIGLGDCGSYVNYLGEGTDNVDIDGKKGRVVGSNGKEKKEKSDKKADEPSEVQWTSYVKYSTTDSKDYIDSDTFADYYMDIIKTIMGGSTNTNEREDEENYAKFLDKTKWIIGGLGSVVGGLVMLKAIPSIVEFGSIGSFTTSSTPGVVENIPAFSANVGAFSLAFVGFSLGTWGGSWLSNKFDRSGPAATTMALSAGVAGAIIGYMLVAGTSTGGFIGIGAALLVISYILLTGIGEVETRYVVFTCEPWEAKTGNNVDCAACNENPLMPCTEYRCNSLGQNCYFIEDNGEEENGECALLNRNDNSAPILELTGISEGYDYSPSDFENQKTTIVSESGGETCLKEFSEIKIDFVTDEFAKCKWSFQKLTSSDYENMEGDFPDNGDIFAKNHSITIPIPSIENILDVYEIEGDIKQWYGNAVIYIKCEDSMGSIGENKKANYNIIPYIINFCINSEPDRTAINHQLTTSHPKNDGLLKYNTIEQNTIFYLHKPAECKYSTQNGTEYEDMIGLMNCITDVNKKSFFGWPCTTTFENLVPGENNFYIKCKAQPWLEGTENESERAVNVEDYEYNLHVSESELKINSVLPQGEVTTGFEPITVELKATTSGGIDNGVATCSYLWGDHWSPFEKSDSTTHNQSGWSVMGGDHAIQIQCQDSADNIATGEISFKVKVDDAAPKVVRAYHEGGNLEIITDEEAKCYYDLNGCYFNLENGTSMTTSFSTKHTTNWNPDFTYYIKCKDKRENINSDCAIKIIPGS
jgi:hypothetical protein